MTIINNVPERNRMHFGTVANVVNGTPISGAVKMTIILGEGETAKAVSFMLHGAGKAIATEEQTALLGKLEAQLTTVASFGYDSLPFAAACTKCEVSPEVLAMALKTKGCPVRQNRGKEGQPGSGALRLATAEELAEDAKSEKKDDAPVAILAPSVASTKPGKARSAGDAARAAAAK